MKTANFHSNSADSWDNKSEKQMEDVRLAPNWVWAPRLWVEMVSGGMAASSQYKWVW